MYIDLILMNKTEYLVELTKSLGFNKVLFNEEIKKLRIKQGSSTNENRKLLESKKIDILLNPHIKQTKNKLNEIQTGLNQVLLNIANKNKILIGLSLDQFSSSESLERIIKIIKLCRKYKVKICVFSLSRTKYDLRSQSDIISLLKIAGMTPGEAKQALNNVLTIIK